MHGVRNDPINQDIRNYLVDLHPLFRVVLLQNVQQAEHTPDRTLKRTMMPIQ